MSKYSQILSCASFNKLTQGIAAKKFENLKVSILLLTVPDNSAWPPERLIHSDSQTQSKADWNQTSIILSVINNVITISIIIGK